MEKNRWWGKWWGMVKMLDFAYKAKQNYVGVCRWYLVKFEFQLLLYRMFVFQLIVHHFTLSPIFGKLFWFYFRTHLFPNVSQKDAGTRTGEIQYLYFQWELTTLLIWVCFFIPQARNSLPVLCLCISWKCSKLKSKILLHGQHFQVYVPVVSFITHAVCSKLALAFHNALNKHCLSLQGSTHFKCNESQKIWYSRLPERDEQNLYNNIIVIVFPCILTLFNTTVWTQ